MSKLIGHTLQNMNAIEQIRYTIEHDVFDYTQLVNSLRSYKKPRDIITTLLKRRHIIRVRKGLYVFGEFWRKSLISREMLANLVYGPSSISFEYALSYYGLIPEKINAIELVTPGRSRSFNTEFGTFIYTQQSIERFACGIDVIKSKSNSWIISNPLKALSDKIWTDKRIKTLSYKNFETYLFNDLRIEKELLYEQIKDEDFSTFAKIYSTKKNHQLIKFLKKHYGIE